MFLIKESQRQRQAAWRHHEVVQLYQVPKMETPGVYALDKYGALICMEDDEKGKNPWKIVPTDPCGYKKLKSIKSCENISNLTDYDSVLKRATSYNELDNFGFDKLYFQALALCHKDNIKKGYLNIEPYTGELHRSDIDRPEVQAALRYKDFLISLKKQNGRK